MASIPILRNPYESKPHYRIIWPAAYPLYYNEARDGELIAEEQCWLYPTFKPLTWGGPRK